MRILIIEDEIKLANAIRRALELQKYAVDTTYNGEQGLDLALGEKFDLIITDIMLPIIDGLEISHQLRMQKNFTPILMLTAKGEIADRVRGLDSGADDYLVKPFSFEELFARVRALVRRSVRTDEPILKIADLTLNPVTFQVTRATKNIKLSSKEFSILEYLLRHSNSVVSKEQIVNHVWNYDSDILPTTIEVHIKHLRDKIDAKPFRPLIRTVRGFGYTIGEET